MAAGTEGREWVLCHGAWQIGPRMLGMNWLEENSREFPWALKCWVPSNMTVGELEPQKITCNPT